MAEEAVAAPPPPAVTEDQPMEIHKPKPIHSWRELLTEIGVVVIGVCIALLAEQTVEWLHWRAQVHEAREFIATELASNLAATADRLRSAECIDRRLDQLATILDIAAKNGSLPPLGDIGVPRHFIWPTGAWDSVVASQTATHFPGQQLADFAGIYKTVQRLASFSDRENDEWVELYTMVGPGRRLDAASEADLRKALSGARYSNRVLLILGQQMTDRIERMRLPFTEAELKSITRAEPEVATYATCRPIGEVPAVYGKAGGVVTPADRASMINQLNNVGKHSSADD